MGLGKLSLCYDHSSSPREGGKVNGWESVWWTATVATLRISFNSVVMSTKAGSK